MSNPKVSVLIPAYNYAQYLPEAIESVLAQTYFDFELIIVDNCSTDNTEDIVRKYSLQDQRIQYIKNQENIGMFRNYNQALLYAKGDYIKFLNADDTLLPHALDSFMTVFKKYKDIQLVTSHKQLIGEQNSIVYQKKIGHIEAEAAIISVLLEGNWIGEPTTVMFKKNLTLGLFDHSLLYFADIDMWLRILSIGNLYVINDILSTFRMHPNQGTVKLHSSSDLIIFNLIEWIEYIRFAIQSNRFHYDLTKHTSIFNFQKKLVLTFISNYRHFTHLKTQKKRFLNFIFGNILTIIFMLPIAIKNKIRNSLLRLIRLFA
jgi:glycosyltransferase involved in cell wall biosynthesis